MATVAAGMPSTPNSTKPATKIQNIGLRRTCHVSSPDMTARTLTTMASAASPAKTTAPMRRSTERPMLIESSRCPVRVNVLHCSSTRRACAGLSGFGSALTPGRSRW